MTIVSTSCARVIKSAKVLEEEGKIDEGLKLLETHTLIRQAFRIACLGLNAQARFDLIALCLSRARIHWDSSCRQTLGSLEDIAVARVLYSRAISLCDDYHGLKHLLQTEFYAFINYENQIKERSFLHLFALISPSLKTLEKLVLRHLISTECATLICIGAAVLALLALSAFVT